MAEEINKRDQNFVTVLSGITDDVAQEIRQLRIDPATNRLLVSAVVAGSQNGKILVDGADTTYEYLADKLVAGTGITLTINNPGGVESITIDASGAVGYDTIQESGVSETQRTRLNFTDYFTVTDNAGNTSTDVAIDVVGLAGDATFISTLEPNLSLQNIGGLLDLSTQVTGLLDGSNIDQSTLDLSLIGGLLDLSTQVTGLLDATNIDITNLESTLDLGNISGQIDLTTQVTGVLPLINGGTGEALVDPGADRIMFWDDSAGEVTWLTAGTGLLISGTTMTATGGSGNGSNIIENLNAGEDIDGVTEPKIVFIGSLATKTPSLQVTTGAANLVTTAYDYSAVTNTAGGNNVAFTGTRRASSFTTPAYATTVNTVNLNDMEGNANGTITAAIEISIYDDNAGEPGNLIVSFTDTSYANINNNFKMLVDFGANAVLAASTTYWIVIETGTDGGNVVNLNNCDAGLGLIFSGGVWVAGHRFEGAVGLRPYIGDVYQSFYDSTSEPREFVLGFTVQNVAEGDPIDVIHDGVVTGFAGLSEAEVQYTPTNTAGVMQTANTTDAVKIGTATKADEIVINRVATYQ